MLISTGFLLALIATLYSDAQLQQMPYEKGAENSKSLMYIWDRMEQKLTLINRELEEQQRKLVNTEFKLNQVLSKLISLTHAKTNVVEKHFKVQLGAGWNTTLERFEHNTNRIFNRMESNVNKWRINKLDEMHSMLALLVTRSQSAPQSIEHKKCNETKESIKTEQINKNNSIKQVQVDYFQPAKADCSQLDEQQRVDGAYKFMEPEWNEVKRDFYERSCTFATSGPAWTIIQRRSTETNFQLKSFNRSWNEYRTGFGDLTEDFWFGNEFIHRIVDRDDFVLRIELEDQNATQVWAEYGIFRLDSESYNYQLVIGKFNENSTAHDAFMYHNRMDFRTYDRNDDCNGWWFDHCQEAQSNLNGDSIIWGNWHNEYTVRASRMLIRPRQLKAIDTDDIFDEDSTY